MGGRESLCFYRYDGFLCFYLLLLPFPFLFPLSVLKGSQPSLEGLETSPEVLKSISCLPKKPSSCLPKNQLVSFPLFSILFIFFFSLSFSLSLSLHCFSFLFHSLWVFWNMRVFLFCSFFFHSSFLFSTPLGLKSWDPLRKYKIKFSETIQPNR